jgi:prepilin-type N-terminal cleavage/methylation domain-containing protein
VTRPAINPLTPNEPRPSGSGRVSDTPRRSGRGLSLGRAGFTLIEMLIVIGVILVLVTIAIIGFRSMELSSAKKQTAVTLASAESMVKELAAIGALSRLEGPSNLTPIPIHNSTGNPLGLTVNSPGDVNLGTGGRTTAINRQQLVMRALRSAPKNQQIIAGLPPQSLVAAPSSGPLDPPVLADAWGNPLHYVPSGGMSGLTINGVINQTIRSGGAVDSTGAPVASPQDRGYWMSAGPDGNFTTFDDNMTSFNP